VYKEEPMDVETIEEEEEDDVDDMFAVVRTEKKKVKKVKKVVVSAHILSPFTRPNSSLSIRNPPLLH
jgi:hypothetical protein